MKPTDQTILHDPANGVFGNRMSAVLASLLHIDVEQVPLFVSDGWQIELNAWLRPYGLAYISFSRDVWLAAMRDFGITGCHHEVAGISPRFADANHACVGHDAQQVFDPHPSRSGLESVASCGVFIALEPWRMEA